MDLCKTLLVLNLKESAFRFEIDKTCLCIDDKNCEKSAKQYAGFYCLEIFKPGQIRVLYLIELLRIEMF